MLRMSGLKFTEDHEWLSMESDEVGVVGITDYAQAQLGDLVFVELPEVGREVSQGEDIGVVESVKTASDIKSPVSGVVVAVNEALSDDPGKVNEDPTGEGWIYKISLSNASEVESLMDDAAYKALTGE
ncbi:glycine cleavage system protein GcvH [Hahella aquimaris]|nr:glycine cleavage system protein GcvH [Hahella sp. HNIBRBA332]WLQ15904.1 glycine cleavage system protein GcvH [Hahella sp. HNIBRBA332]